MSETYSVGRGPRPFCASSCFGLSWLSAGFPASAETATTRDAMKSCLSATAALLLLLAAYWLGRYSRPVATDEEPTEAVRSDLEPRHHKPRGRKRGGGHKRGGRKPWHAHASTKHGRRRHGDSLSFNRSAALDELFEARLHVLESLPQEPGAWVECGHHLAATCAACVTGAPESGATECRGECSWNEARSECVAMHGSTGGGAGGSGAPAPHRPTFQAEHHEFDASNRALWVLTPSLVGAVGLSLALMGSAAAQAHQCMGARDALHPRVAASPPAALQALCGTEPQPQP